MSTLIRRFSAIFGKKRRPRRRPVANRCQLRPETLEQRRVLAATNLGIVEGTVFVDSNSNGGFDAGEEFPGASVQLYLDNGNGVLDGADTLSGNDTTDSNGVYQFTGLTTGTYFVRQPAQTVSTLDLPEMTSTALAISGTGTTGVPVDAFTTASGPTVDTFPSGTPVEEVHTAAEALGGQRDFQASLTGGIAGDTVSVRSTGGALVINPDFNAIGTYIVAWDGIDAAGSGLNTTGLGGVDLTLVGGSSGVGAGIQLTDVEVDQPGGVVTLRIYTDASNYSEATISPITPFTSQDFYIPFEGVMDGLGFTDVGAGASFDNVGAIELTFQATQQAMDGQLSLLGVIGNDIETANFGNPAPMPAIDIEKLTNGNQADLATDADVPIVTPGSTVTWSYVVTNTGDTDLNNVTVTDNQVGVVTNLVSRAGGDNDTVFEPGEVWTYEATGTAITGAYENSATVTAADNSGTPVTDTDLSHYEGVAASIDIEKFTNGNQADLATDADVPTITAGNAVTWTYEVTNTSTLDLTNVQVTDSDTGVVATIISRSINADNTLDPGEVWTYQVTGTALGGSYENQGTVTAVAAQTGQSVTDSDLSHYFGSQPAIDIEKATNGEDADAPGTGPTVYEGSLVTFTYTVRNTGNVALTNVQVRDDNGTPTNTTDDFFANFISGDSDGDSALDLTETWTFRGTRTATLGSYQNNSVVTADDPGGNQVTDSDPSNHTAIEPPTFITKRGFLASSG